MRSEKLRPPKAENTRSESLSKKMQKPEAPNQSNNLSALFARLRVVSVVVVDDAIDRELDASLVARILGIKPDARASVEAFFPGIDLSNDNEHLFDQISGVWGNLDNDQLGSLRTALSDHDDEATDLAIASMIKDLMPSDMDLEFLTPDLWAQRREELLSATSEDQRTLFLFDQELKTAGTQDFAKGSDIISQLSRAHENSFGTRWFAGILSYTLARGDEIATWRTMAEEENLKLQFFMPISKQNLHNAEAFYGAVYRTVITSYTEKMKAVSSEAFKSALTFALKRFEDLDPLDFEHLLVASGQREGVSELDNLIRLYSIVQKDSIKAAVLSTPASTDFLASARLVNGLVDLNRALPGESKKRLAGLRYEELYESASLVNRFHDPIRNGDLFTVGSSQALQMYVLIAQPCDLMVRTKGKRGRDDYFKVAVLAPIRRSKLGSPPSPKGPHFLLEHIDHDGLQCGLVDFPEASPADLHVLDLAVLREDGQCWINTKGDCFPQLPSKAWCNRIDAIKSYFGDCAGEIELARDHYGDAAAAMMASIRVPPVAAERSFRQHGSYENGQFSYDVRRCGRVREPVATALLAAFSQFLSRDAVEYDFSR